MHHESVRLKNHVHAIYEQYKHVDDQTASINLAADKWSLKEIIGHLVDSAANNYQRFIRLQETDILSFPGYDYNWIKIVKYNAYPFIRILKLWKQYNLLLGHIIANINADKKDHRWLTGAKPLTLEFLVKDYIDHMETHIDHLHERFNAISQDSCP